MNILPKKSWHVRSQKNIERVKRDEAQAAEERKQRQERAALAEQEARTSLLRRKARQLTSGQDHEGCGLPLRPDDDRLAVETAEDQDATSKHVDFFSSLGTEKPKGEKNKEHEKEEKAAKEKYERSIGLLTYLGQSAAEAQTTKPWYFKPPHRATATSTESEEQSCTDMKSKASLDPMMAMEKYLGVKRSKGDTAALAITSPRIPIKTSSPNRVPVSGNTVPKLHLKDSESQDRRSTHREHSGKSKHKHKHKLDRGKSKGSKERKDKHRDAADTEKKRRHKDRRGGRKEVDMGPSLQQLREERLRREATERIRTNRLLSGEKLEGRGGSEPEEQMERPRRYNSQFHPELARNRHRPSHYTVA